jgi:hypothetical protein
VSFHSSTQAEAQDPTDNGRRSIVWWLARHQPVTPSRSCHQVVQARSGLPWSIGRPQHHVTVACCPGGKVQDRTCEQGFVNAKDSRLHCESTEAATICKNSNATVQGGKSCHSRVMPGFREPFIDVQGLAVTHGASDRWDPIWSEASLVASGASFLFEVGNPM